MARRFGGGACCGPLPALADGELHIYNWGDYTNPELIKKFEKQYNIKVTHGRLRFRTRRCCPRCAPAIPATTSWCRRDYTVKIMIDEGLLEKTEPNAMQNVKNVDPRFRQHLLGRRPPLHGAVAVRHDGLRGQHRQVQGRHRHAGHPVQSAGRAEGPDQHARRREHRHACGERYVGVPRCGADKANLKKVNDMLHGGQAVLEDVQLRHHHQDRRRAT